MNYFEVIEIFKNLQKKGLIDPNRKIVLVKFKFYNCCSFAARHRKDERKMLELKIFNHVIFSFKPEYYIECDADKIEFLDEATVMCTLLHEEGHMRFFNDKLDWNDQKIDNIPKQSVQLKKENEFKADKYAARIFLEKYPELDPCVTMRRLFLAYQKCCEKHKSCLIKRKISKFFHKIEHGVDDYHPPFDERLKMIEEYCSEKKRKLM